MHEKALARHKSARAKTINSRILLEGVRDFMIERERENFILDEPYFFCIAVLC